jgi:hypothetical protein
MERPEKKEDAIQIILTDELKKIWKDSYNVEFNSSEQNIAVVWELTIRFFELYLNKKYGDVLNTVISKRNELELKYNFLYPKEFFIDFLEYMVSISTEYPELYYLTYRGPLLKKYLWEDLIEKMKRFNFYKDYEVNVDLNFENPYQNSKELVLN